MGDHCEFVVPIQEVEHMQELPIPRHLDSKIGHLVNVTLRRRGMNDVWPCFLSRIKIESSGRVRLSFSLGWNKVCDENDIQLHGLVAFICTGFNTFTFAIFGRNRVLSRSPAEIREQPEDVLIDRRGVTGRVPAWVGSGHHADAAVAFVSTSLHEHFNSEMKAGYQSVRHLTIPNVFAKRCLPYERVNKVRCVVQDYRGKDWPMVIKFNKRPEGVLTNCYFTEGLKDYATEHELPKHTIIAFELLTLEEPLFLKVHAFLK